MFPTNWTTAEGELYSGYREKGYHPQAFINMLAFLGWNPGTTQEIFSLEELVEAFSLERVNKAGAKFDAEKTKWFQQHYLRATADKELATDLKKIITSNLSDEYLTEVCRLMKERATFVGDIPVEGAYLLAKPSVYDQTTIDKKWKDETAGLLSDWKTELQNTETWTAENLEDLFKAYITSKGVGIGAVLANFRLVITGAAMGPSMFEIIVLLGKEETLARMEEGMNYVSQHR